MNQLEEHINERKHENKFYDFYCHIRNNANAIHLFKLYNVRRSFFRRESNVINWMLRDGDSLIFRWYLEDIAVIHNIIELYNIQNLPLFGKLVGASLVLEPTLRNCIKTLCPLIKYFDVSDLCRIGMYLDSDAYQIKRAMLHQSIALQITAI